MPTAAGRAVSASKATASLAKRSDATEGSARAAASIKNAARTSAPA